MNEIMRQILYQTFIYGSVMAITIFIVSMFMRGFLVNYFRVRTSFGKYLLVKIRNQLRDYYRVGWVEDGMLTYKPLKLTSQDKTKYVRISKNTAQFVEKE